MPQGHAEVFVKPSFLLEPELSAGLATRNPGGPGGPQQSGARLLML